MSKNVLLSDWVRCFFGGSNTLLWEELRSRTAPDDWAVDLLPWLAIIEKNDPCIPLVLPHRNQHGSVIWYGVAQTPQAALGLAEDLAGHIGQSYGGFSGQPHILDLTNKTEAALAAMFVDPIFRICPSTAKDETKIRRSIFLYCGLVGRRPPASRLAARSLGALRSRFDRAILAGNESAAQRLFDEILATGRLSWDNLLYLRIRLYAGLGMWSQIAGDIGLLQEASHLVLPARVRADLVEALYRIHAEPWEETDDAVRALAAFRPVGMGRFRALFATRQGLASPRVVKAFLLFTLLRTVPDSNQLDELCALLPESTPDETSFSVALRNLADEHRKAPVSGPNIENANQAYDDLNYDLALNLYAALPISRYIIGRLLACANMIRKPYAAQVALAAVDAWPEGVQNLPSHVKNVVAELRVLIASLTTNTETTDNAIPVAGKSAYIPSDWLSWARWLASGAHPEQARRLLDEYSVVWSVDALREDPKAIIELANILGNASGAAAQVVQLAFPRLFEIFIIGSDKPIPACKPLYATLLTMLAMAESLSHDDLELARMLAVAMLEVGVEPKEYINIVQDLEELLERQVSLATLDWALDMAEVLAINRAPQPELQLSFIMKVLNIGHSRLHRLVVAQMGMLRCLYQDIGIVPPPELVSCIEEGNGLIRAMDLGGRNIAIYTLTETVGRRVMTMLRHLFPTVEVSLNSDLTCSNRLANLARRSDIFVFAWRSSKHAAYYCVKDNRPINMPMLLPRGKGSASILRELVGG
ncbi:MAG: hypothetical protein HQM05_10090 [Magnetococcales bacterium]|nr:hypothetical protein [Magnetococcales bacterium]